jgi:hypothetical protein
VTYINYVKIMSVFNNVMGVLRCLFCIVLFIYHFRRYYLNYKLSLFQSIVIWLMQCLTIVQMLYSFMWNYRVFVNCELWSISTAGCIDMIMFVIGILVTYYLFTAINKIHKFAQKGRLPRESSQRHLKQCLIALIVISGLIIVNYVVLNYYFV